MFSELKRPEFGWKWCKMIDAISETDLTLRELFDEKYKPAPN